MWSNGRLNFSWSSQRGIWITSNYLSELKISFGCIKILHCIECGRILQRASLVRWPEFPSLTTFFLRWPRFQSKIHSILIKFLKKISNLWVFFVTSLNNPYNLNVDNLCIGWLTFYFDHKMLINFDKDSKIST